MCGDSQKRRPPPAHPSHRHLKGVWYEIFDFRFFHESVFPRTIIIQFRQCRIFKKTRGDREVLERLINGIKDSHENCWNTKFFHILGCCLHSYNGFYLMLTLRCRQADIVVTVSSPESDNSDKVLLSHARGLAEWKRRHHCIPVPKTLIFKPVKK